MESIYFRKYNNHQIACSLSDTGSRDIVIFCHGFRSSSVGPNRFFVEVTRKLAKHKISSLRFDQYGSGNSEGDFLDSSFKDWIQTAKIIAQDYIAQGFRVSLLGQSMGGATVISVGAILSEVQAIVAWVPDPNVDTPIPQPNGIFEEGGQKIRDEYWVEAHDEQVAQKLHQVKSPVYIIQCSDDEYVAEENHQAIANNTLPHHKVEMFEGYKHSSWTREQADTIITKTVDFFTKELSDAS